MSSSNHILWASLADLSYGGCAREDLIIVNEADLTDEDQAALDDAVDENDFIEILCKIHDGLNDKGADNG